MEYSRTCCGLTAPSQGNASSSASARAWCWSPSGLQATARVPGTEGSVTAWQLFPGDFIADINRLSLLCRHCLILAIALFRQPDNFTGPGYQDVINHSSGVCHTRRHVTGKGPARANTSPAPGPDIRQADGRWRAYPLVCQQHRQAVTALESAPVDFTHAGVESYGYAGAFGQLMLVDGLQRNSSQGRYRHHRDIQPPGQALNHAGGNT